jgi:lipopolysaccharide/colanic/teichoic acid biosynthesis glycosyltransferase
VDRRWRALRLIAVAGDGLAVLAGYSLAGLWLVGVDAFLHAGPVWSVYPSLSVGAALLAFPLGRQAGVYAQWALIGGHRVYPLLIRMATGGVLGVLLLSYFLAPSVFVARGWLVASWGLSCLFLSVGRLLVVRQLALHWRATGRLVSRVLIAGANRHGVAVAQQINDPARHGTEVMGFLDDYQRPGTEVAPGLRVVGHPTAVLEHARSLGAEEVIIISNALSWESQRVLAELVTRPDAPLRARISATFYDLLTTSADLGHVAYVPMLTLHRTRLSGPNAVLKALLDRMVAAAGLVALVPLFVVLLARARMRGVRLLRTDPAVGLHGHAIRLLGFSPDLVDSPVVRRLPALWNVWRGDLSLVGPRPTPAGELATRRPWLTNLQTMRPGLTGLWRLRSELSLEQSVGLDLYYVRNYSLVLDAQLLFNTARMLVGQVLLGRQGRLARWGAVAVGASSVPSPGAVVAPKGLAASPLAGPRSEDTTVTTSADAQ